MSIQSINKQNENFGEFMKSLLNTTTLLNQQFGNNVIINNVIDKNTHFMSFESNTTKIECEIKMNIIDEKLNVVIVHSKLLKLFIENTTKKECVFNFTKNFVITNSQNKQIYDQFQVVFAYLNLMDNKNKSKNMN